MTAAKATAEEDLGGPSQEVTTQAQAAAQARMILLGAVSPSEPWAVIATQRWEKGMVPAKTILRYESARYIYLRMGSPRTITRLRQGAAFLGFSRPPTATLRNWRSHGCWTEEAMAYDMGIMSLREMKDRLAGMRRGVVISVMESMTETLSLALDAETMEKAIHSAAGKGDFKGLVEGAQKLLAEINMLAGEALPTAGMVHQHQHVHAHVPGEPGAAGAPVPAGTSVERVLGLLDNAAERKRNTKPAIEGPAGPTINLTATKEPSDERQSVPIEQRRKPGRPRTNFS